MRQLEADWAAEDEDELNLQLDDDTIPEEEAVAGPSYLNTPDIIHFNQQQHFKQGIYNKLKSSPFQWFLVSAEASTSDQVKYLSINMSLWKW